MKPDIKKIELPATPEAQKALETLLKQKADMRLDQKKALDTHVAIVKKPAV